MSGTLTTDEAADLLGVSRKTIRRWSDLGLIRPVRPHARPVRWREEDLQRARLEMRRDRGRLEAIRREILGGFATPLDK